MTERMGFVGQQVQGWYALAFENESLRARARAHYRKDPAPCDHATPPSCPPEIGKAEECAVATQLQLWRSLRCQKGQDRSAERQAADYGR